MAKLFESNAAVAEIAWNMGQSQYVWRSPYIGYNPSLIVPTIEILNGKNGTWDIVVRNFSGFEAETRNGTIVFQFASPRAPHSELVPGLTFQLLEGLRTIVWTGEIKQTFLYSRDPSLWLQC